MISGRFISFEFLFRATGKFQTDTVVKKTINIADIVSVSPIDNPRDPRKTVNVRFREQIDFDDKPHIEAEAIGTYEEISKLLTGDYEKEIAARAWAIPEPSELIRLSSPLPSRDNDFMISIVVGEKKDDYHNMR